MKITKQKVKKLYNDFKELKTYDCLFRYNKNDYNKYRVSLSENCKPIYPHQGIYFLLENNYVTYVGMSIASIENRIFGDGSNNFYTNHSNTKIFNSFKVLNLESENKNYITDLECTYINMFAPPQNAMLNNKYYVNLMPLEYTKENTLGKKSYKEYTDLISEQHLKSIRQFHLKDRMNNIIHNELKKQ